MLFWKVLWSTVLMVTFAFGLADVKPPIIAAKAAFGTASE